MTRDKAIELIERYRMSPEDAAEIRQATEWQRSHDRLATLNHDHAEAARFWAEACVRLERAKEILKAAQAQVHKGANVL